MPKYHIFSWTNKIKEPTSEGIIDAKSVRAAFQKFKKQYKDRISPLKEFQLYPINHARIWNYKKGKWTISSFYGNHNQKEYQEKQRKQMKRFFEQREQLKNKIQ